mmetsp:Transcript_8250/g.15624  ORF Transcript_8250/g.15624 Transcript_8250/m.15624 type:complete len:234 (+) Transcript_8250:2931-3632(+)
MDLLFKTLWLDARLGPDAALQVAGFTDDESSDKCSDAARWRLRCNTPPVAGGAAAPARSSSLTCQFLAPAELATASGELSESRLARERDDSSPARGELTTSGRKGGGATGATISNLKGSCARVSPGAQEIRSITARAASVICGSFITVSSFTGCNTLAIISGGVFFRMASAIRVYVRSTSANTVEVVGWVGRRGARLITTLESTTWQAAAAAAEATVGEVQMSAMERSAWQSS